MIFIKLTLANRKKEVFLNAEKITDLMLTDSESETMVSLQGEQNFYNVLEKPEEIIKKIRAEEERQKTLIEVFPGEEISSNDVDLIDRLEGYIKDFRIEYAFDGHLNNSFKLVECTQGEVFIRTCYPEINDCIKASFRFMDNYLKTGNFKS